MPRFTMKAWVFAACGVVLGTAAAAAEPSTVVLADGVFRDDGQNWIQQVSNGDGGGLFSAELGDPWDLSDSMASRMGREGGSLNYGGWFQGGYTNHPDGTFNTHPHHFHLHQGWLYVEKPTDGADGLDIGGRVDVIYGVDGANTQAFGNDFGVYDFSDTFNHGIYGWAIPQLYVEGAYHDWKIKAGHFFTLLGYEVVPATGNFFYSHAYTMNYSEAFTHTGAVATYTGIENVELYGGWTLGWDTGFDQFDGGNSFLGGFKVTPVEDISFIYICTAGNLGFIGEGYSHSMVVDFTLSDKLHYITQSDFISTEGSEVLGTDYDTIGWNNYLIYWATERVGFGGRAEWWKVNGNSVCEVTAGINFKPCANMIIRPEWRYNWSPSLNSLAPAAAVPGIGVPAGLFSFEHGIFGVDAIITY